MSELDNNAPGREADAGEGATFGATLLALAPYLVVSVLVSVFVVFGVSWALNRMGMSSVGGSPQIATFDIFKYINAQRAVAEAFVKPSSSDSLTASQILADMPSKTRDAIAQVAGPRTLVVIKQAVVQGQARDITDQVLRLLGLPTNVPSTVSNLSLAGDYPVFKIQTPGAETTPGGQNQLP